MRSRRITQREWQAINSALAYCSSGGPEDVSMAWEEWRTLSIARDKVAERIDWDNLVEWKDDE